MNLEEKKWRIELAAMVLSHSESISTDSIKDAFDIVETMLVEADRRYGTTEGVGLGVNLGVAFVHDRSFTELACTVETTHWTDTETGFTWHVEPGWRGTHYEAVGKFGDALPSREELEEFRRHGGPTNLSIGSKWCWSSTLQNHVGFAAILMPGEVGHAIRAFDDGAALLVERK